MKRVYLSLLGATVLSLGLAASSHADVKTYSCNLYIQLQVDYQGSPGAEYADSIVLTGSGSNLDGQYSALGDGVLFANDVATLNPGALYIGSASGRVVVSSQGKTLLDIKCDSSTAD